jgi:hypothetical protein
MMADQAIVGVYYGVTFTEMKHEKIRCSNYSRSLLFISAVMLDVRGAYDNVLH